MRSLASQVRLDARTKLLNPKWYEGMMSSGYEGVREIQKRLTNTMGWSATSGQVRPASVPHLLAALSCCHGLQHAMLFVQTGCVAHAAASWASCALCPGSCLAGGMGSCC